MLYKLCNCFGSEEGGQSSRRKHDLTLDWRRLDEAGDPECCLHCEFDRERIPQDDNPGPELN